MEGFFRGVASSWDHWNYWYGWDERLEVKLRVDLIELDPRTGREILVDSGEALSPLLAWAWSDPVVWSESFGRRLEARLRPGATYRVRLHLQISAWGWWDYNTVDIGSPGSPGLFARYGRIKVCVDPPSGVEGALEALEAKADALEGKTDALESKMDAMQSDITDIGGQVVENGQKLDILEAKLDQVLVLLGGLDAKQCESIRLHLTPEGLRASDCCEAETSFPDGKWVPSCGGTVLGSPVPPPLLQPVDPPRSP